MDLEWLGAGRVRYGIYQDGIPTYVHQITNTNSLGHSDVIYMSTPNLPVRYEVINSGSVPANLHQICSTVISEGGVDTTGPIRSIDMPRGGTITVTAATQAALIAIRLKSTALSATVIPRSFSISNQGGNNSFKYMLLLNPTVNSAFTFANVANSAIQYATGSSAHTITNEGTKLVSGYVTSNIDSSTVPFNTATALGSAIDGTSDVLVLACYNFGVNTTLAGSLTWQETV